MSTYRLTPAAQRDLSSIWDYTQERWDLAQPEVYVTEIRAAIERIAGHPSRWRRSDEIRAVLAGDRRALPAGALKQRKRAWNLQLEHPTK